MNIQKMIDMTSKAITAMKMGRILAEHNRDEEACVACDESVDELNQMLGALSILADNADVELRSDDR